MASTSEESLLRKFVFENILSQDTRSKSINLLGRINSTPAIILAEKTAFDTTPHSLANFAQPSNLPTLKLMESNDIYYWFLASHGSVSNPEDLLAHGEVKFTLIYPATDSHVKKYSFQNSRMVTETPAIYREFVKPYVEAKRGNGRLNWVYNILEHKTETERIVVEDTDLETGFILLPDLKWDQKTMASLYMLALVNRRDIMSLRDLKKKHVPWLRGLQKKIVDGICLQYPEVKEDQLKLYIHYQPSYYHFHIHAVSVSHDGGFGQAAGKALLLGNVISQLENMAGGYEAGFEDVELVYCVGEEMELWQNVFVKVKEANAKN
ncbi:hypothetical protein RUND412_009405 [Rhizina undulata]